MEKMDFETDKEEMEYLRKKVQDLQIELEEYQESSRELETELEAQLNSSEKRNSELKSMNSRLQMENENLKSKLTILQQQSQQQIFDLEKQLNETQVNNAKLSRCIRELEQSNDDLERAKRALHASLDDFERKLNHQIEKNVLLENELGEKEQLEVAIQRLKDETRDLKQELTVRQQQPMISKTPTSPANASSLTSVVVNEDAFNLNNLNNGLQGKSVADRCRSESFDTGSTKSRTVLPNFYNGNVVNSKKNSLNSDTDVQLNPNEVSNPMFSPSTRISVLNIVSDLLRKVGALESKLASCKTMDFSSQNSSPTKSKPLPNNRLTNSTSVAGMKEISSDQLMDQ